jgi:hypothetical protein
MMQYLNTAWWNEQLIEKYVAAIGCGLILGNILAFCGQGLRTISNTFRGSGINSQVFFLHVRYRVTKMYQTTYTYKSEFLTLFPLSVLLSLLGIIGDSCLQTINSLVHRSWHIFSDSYTIIFPTKCTSSLKAQYITICTFLPLYS